MEKDLIQAWEDLFLAVECSEHNSKVAARRHISHQKLSSQEDILAIVLYETKDNLPCKPWEDYTTEDYLFKV